MGLALSIFVLGCFAVITFRYWEQLEEREDTAARRAFLVWFGKGVMVPVLLWVLFNSGLLARVPFLVPDIELIGARRGSRLSAWADVTAAAVLVIGSYWMAVTFAVMLAAIAGRVDSRRDFVAWTVIWSVVLAPLAWAMVRFGGWGLAGLATTVWLLPVVHYTRLLIAGKPAAPAYSRAIGKMKFGKFQEAEREVLGELDKCEDDFEGWMMLAELYAHHFNDLAGADQTIHELCRDPKTTGVQIVIAMNRLADWHLKLGQDPVAARRALEEICRRLPGTHVDRMARQRLSQLPATGEELRERAQGRTIRLPALTDPFDEPANRAAPEPDREEARARARQCVERLERDPDDVPAREELARVFAERLGETDQAIEQIELLLEIPGQPAPKAAEWLALMAAWHLRYRRDGEAARKLLERLVREHPRTSQAFAAQRRLGAMAVEERMRQARAAAVGSREASAPAPRPEGSSPDVLPR